MAKTGKGSKGAVTPGQRMAGLAVHAFTAAGALLGFLALLAAIEGGYTAMFAWLTLALFVDAVDGTLARKADVSRTAPEFSGETLDLVVDYVTYVLVPAYAMHRAGLMPEQASLAATALILVTAALYFADTRMKTDDWHFRGFPGVWNLFAFLAFVFRPDPWLLVAIVIVFAALTFAPLKVVHPMRVERFKMLSLGMLVTSGALCALALWHALDPPAVVKAGLVATAAYFLGVGLLPSNGRNKRRQTAVPKRSWSSESSIFT
jgi:phosphatidylcholine synthase